jgi:activator of Hsp90 ATPase-like protein
LRFEPATEAVESFDGEVLAFDPPAMLEFRWGTDVIRIELEPDGDGTRLTLLDTIDELGKAARDAAGWHVCLDQLEHHLDRTAPRWSPSERWRELHPSYVEELGPEAAAIGPPAGALD